MQMGASATFEPLQPEEVRAMSPASIEVRTNHLGQLIFTLFKTRRELLMELPGLQEAKDEEPTPENEAALGRCRSELSIAKKTIDAISNEIQFINHYHSYAWNFTQVLLDTIEIGHASPRSGRWK